MPVVSRFFGILILMYFNDHAPPHFHVRYGGKKAVIDIEQLRVIEGNLPPRVLGLVAERTSLHQDELRSNWLLAAKHVEPHPIQPLE
jgi:hypothetical protein